MARWQWRPKLARFWNATVGRLSTRLQIRTWADQVITASPVRQWAGQVARGDITVGAWQEQMRAEIKRNYIQQYLAGRGGTGQMTAKDYGSIGGQIADQYRYLDRFAQEIADGTLTEGQIARRAEMYINSSREAYERAQERSAADAELRSVRWVLGVAEHCVDCVALAAMGWQAAKPWPFQVGRRNAYPGSGDTGCKTNCKCHLVWRKNNDRKG